MIEPSCSTSIRLELQGCDTFGVSFACSTCGHVSHVTLERAEDGIVVSNYRGDSPLLRLWRYNPFAVRTGDGKLSIFCGVCRSGKTRVTVLPEPDGISYSPKKGNSNDVYPDLSKLP